MEDEQGQLSLELILIFAISIIVLTIFTLPLSELAIGNTLEVSEVINTKSNLYEIANGINEVYSQGQGAKKTITINSDNSYLIKISPNSLTTTLTLENGDKKNLKVNHEYNNLNLIINIEKGKNRIIINWDENSDYLTVKK